MESILVDILHLGVAGLMYFLVAVVVGFGSGLGWRASTALISKYTG